jgi:transposase-like protein
MVPIITDLFTTFKNKRKYEDAKQLMGVRYQQTFNKELTYSRLKRILHDPVYIGKPRYKTDTRCDPELAMINEVLFNEVQEIIGRFKKSDDSKEEKQNAFKAGSKLYGLGFALRTFPEFVAHCICGGHMVIHDGSITKGVWVSRYVCPNPNCKRSKTVPTGKQIDSYKHLNLLSCPYCRETEHFTYCKLQNGDEYIYKCQQCGGSFKSTIDPNRYLRTVAIKKDKVPAVDQLQQENKTKKQVRNSSLDLFT